MSLFYSSSLKYISRKREKSPKIDFEPLLLAFSAEFLAFESLLNSAKVSRTAEVALSMMF